MLAQERLPQPTLKAQEGAQQAKRTVRDQVDQRSTEAGQRVSTTAQDIRSVGDELRNQGKDQPAKLADQAAERAEKLSEYLTRSDGDTILRDVEDFGRRQPWAVIAGGIALGFAASRFLKASSSRRYQTYESSSRLPARTQDVAPLMLFYRADRDGNGKISREEFDGLFAQWDSGQQGFLALSDLESAFRMPTAPANPPKGEAPRNSGPSKETLIRGLFRQEIGSLQPGPALGDVRHKGLGGEALEEGHGAADVIHPGHLAGVERFDIDDGADDDWPIGSV